MPLTFNGNTPENVNWNGIALSKVTYNGGVVWERRKRVYKANENWAYKSSSPSTYIAKNIAFPPGKDGNNYTYYMALLKFPINIEKPCTIKFNIPFITTKIATFRNKAEIVSPEILNNIDNLDSAFILNSNVGDIQSINMDSNNGITDVELTFDITQEQYNSNFASRKELLLCVRRSTYGSCEWELDGLGSTDNPITATIT